MDDFFTYLVICVCIVGIIIFMKKGKDGAGPNSRFGNFRNIFLFVVLGIALQFISSSSYAFNLSSFNTSSGFPRFSGQGYNNASNNFTTCDPSIEACGGSYNKTYKYTCYSWGGRNTNHYYWTNYNTSAHTTTCESPNTIGQGYTNSTTNNIFVIRAIYDNGTTNGAANIIPGISAQANGEGIDFAYIRGFQGKLVYSVPSNAGFTVDYGSGSYFITKVFFYPNRYVFSTADGSFMYEVGAAGNTVNGFFVMDPSLSLNNIYYVVPMYGKAWSMTLSQSVVWDLLLGNTSYSSLLGDNGISDLFETSYTIEMVSGGSIYPPSFVGYPQDNDIGFSYTQDLDFVPPPSSGDGGLDGGGSAWGDEEVDSTINILDSIKGIISNQGEWICKSTNGALLYQNDFEQYLGTYARYKNNCENNVYAPTPYDNGTGSTWSLKALWTWVQNQALTLVGDSNNENVCAYADYLSGRVHAFVNSIDCGTCKQQYLENLKHDFGSNVVDSNLCINTSVLLDSVEETIGEVDPSTDNINKMASKLLSTFKDPYMSGYRAIITPTCYYGQNFERANYLLYGIFALYIFILFKLLH